MHSMPELQKRDAEIPAPRSRDMGTVMQSGGGQEQLMLYRYCVSWAIHTKLR